VYGGRYFAKRYYAGRYFPPAGQGIIATVAGTIYRIGSYVGAIARRGRT